MACLGLMWYLVSRWVVGADGTAGGRVAERGEKHERKLGH